MTSNSSSSRAAAAIVGILVVAAIIWFYLMREDGVPSSQAKQVTEKASTKVAERNESNTSASAADINSESESGTEVSQSGLKKPLARATESNSSKESKDFRVSSEDKYASVPDGHFFTTSGMTDLVPDGVVRSFRIGHRVYAYVAVHAPRKETVRITWLDSNNNEVPPSAYLDVLVNTGPIGYRVFTYRTFRAPGKYTVKLTNSVGVEIGVGQFEVYK